ncbi:hypothetical protein KO533_21710 [Shewanella sp. NKUCC05_KAH]|uniref:hypothetical protein n=1 Tax=Shewanella sp. NKUCC05_KAH TaxID=2842126 RepID=UPI001C5BAB70|nr:hypothetical protein [Shewanella sp. NKUCC05_KAH]MBW3529161.1 hypothetical protein [Shewanella sp. NKUCC05_KAH]
MTSLTSFNVTKTFPMIVSDNNYTIRFAENIDEFVIFVSNDSNGKQSKYHFERDTASDFKYYHGEELHDQVLEIIRSDIQNGTI